RKPGRSNVRVKSVAGTLSAHGVRQLTPVDALASAPGGSDSTVSTPVGDPNGTLKLKSQLGIHEQPASAQPQAARATTRVTPMVPSTDIPPPPREPYEGHVSGATGTGCGLGAGGSDRRQPLVSPAPRPGPPPTPAVARLSR